MMRNRRRNMQSYDATGQHDGRRGFTLVEVAVSTVVIATMLVAALTMVGGVFRNYAIARESQRAFALADELMAEVLQSRYEDPNGVAVFGRETGEDGTTRTDFDDVDDYAGWEATPPQTKDGAPMANASGWTQAVAVCWADPLAPDVNPGVESGLKRITVAITSPRGQVVPLTGLRGAAGLLELQPPVDRTYVTGVQTSLEIGTESGAGTDAAFVGNHARDQ